MITMEKASRKSGNGDFRSNIRQMKKEKELLAKAGFQLVSLQADKGASEPKKTKKKADAGQADQ